MVSNRGSVVGLLRWQSRNALIFVLGGVVAVIVHDVHDVLDTWLGLLEVGLPTLPLAVVGGALGIFVSFRTNSAYDRWWEARKLWGRLINSSRHWSSQVSAYVGDPELRRELVLRHVAYVHVLRCLLRKQDALADADVQRALPAGDREALAGESNLTHALLDRQLARVTALADAGGLDALRLQSLDETVRALLDIQGGCERIKKTPIPRGYGFIAETLIVYFSFLLPFGMVDDLHLLVIPINLLVCMAFLLISEAGRVLEDPFTLFWNGLPLQDMSTTIEQNLRNRLGEKGLPPPPGPDSNGILM